MSTREQQPPLDDPFHPDYDHVDRRGAALDCARCGIAVILLWGVRNGICLCPDGAKCKNKPGKHPATLHGSKDATTDPDVIKRWFDQYPDANYGIATGTISGIFVLDVDPRKGGSESLAELERVHGKLPDTHVVNTGGGGWHPAS